MTRAADLASWSICDLDANSGRPPCSIGDRFISNSQRTPLRRLLGSPAGRLRPWRQRAKQRNLPVRPDST